MTQPTVSRAKPRSRRWIRAVAPFIVLFAVWVFVGVVHAIEQPNLGDPGTLSPQGTGPDGSSTLAALLAERGVTIDRVTSSQLALAAAASTDATIFLPTPDLLHPAFLNELTSVDGRHRLVVVHPGARTLMNSPAPIYPVYDRWATATVAPRCATPYAAEAGPAAMLRTGYIVDDFDGATASVDCYSGGLVGVRHGDLETLYIGATDPFRNGRIGEAGNTAIAVDLLTEFHHVIWVDVHQREKVVVTPSKAVQVAPPKYRRGALDRTGTGNSTIDAFPTVLWASMLLILLTAVLYAIARARRLGSPVAEPLPVLVPAAEAVTGRGRLYHQIHARQATLDTLRAAAIARLSQLLNPFNTTVVERDLVPRGGVAPVGADSFVAQIAARTGLSAEWIHGVLYGREPSDDMGLTQAVADLDQLVHAVVYERPAPKHQGGTP